MRFTVPAAVAVLLVQTLGVFGLAGIPTSEVGAQEIDEIIVTARRREERLQDIPLSISAFTADDIEAAGFQDLGDIALQTAGVVYNPRSFGRANSNIRIRGASAGGLPHVQATSLFIDGAFALGGVNSMPLTDLERVEIIKGPQSAFFGRNTFAGAVNYITKTPSLDEFETKIDASAANYEQYELSLLTSGPIIEGKLGYQVNVRLMNRGDMYTATDGGGLGEESTQSISGVLYWEPNERLSVKLRGMFLRDDDGAPVTTFLRGADFDSCTGRVYPGRFADDGSPYTIDFTNGRPGGGPVNYICGKPPNPGESGAPPISSGTTLRPAIFSQTPGVFNTITGEMTGTNPDLLIDQLVNNTFIPGVPYIDHFGLERINRRVALTVEYEFENGIAATFLAANNLQDMNIIRDFDRTDVEAWYSQDPQFFDDSSFEARFVSNQDRRLRWVGGATWYEQEFITNGDGGLSVTGLFDLGIPFFVPSGVLAQPATKGDKAEVWGVFGALSYDFTDKLTLDAEVRIMADERTVDALGTLLAETYDSTVPRVILSYQPDADTNIYGQFSKGSLPGRVNGPITTCSPDPFLVPYEDPLNPGTLITLSECEQMARQGGLPFTKVQELDAFEVGIKKSLADGRVNLTAAAYFWDWTAKPSGIVLTWVRDADNPEDRDGIPNTFANSQTSTVAGSSEMYGLDLESAFQFTDNWSATLNLSWTETEFTEFSAGNRVQLTGTRNQKGNEEAQVPNFKGGFSTTYNRQLNSEWGWFTRLDVMYQGDYWAEPENLAEGPAFTLAHARIGAEKDDLRIELFVRNLFDEDTWRKVSSWVDFTPQPVDFNFLAHNGVSLTAQDRRTIGVRMSMSF